METGKTIKEGYWLYDNSVRKRVKITSETFRPGSGDYEDEPEYQDDKEGKYFAVWYETDNDVFNSGGGYYDSESEAISAIEKTIGQKVIWQYAG